jgi:hypothetical protein
MKAVIVLMYKGGLKVTLGASRPQCARKFEAGLQNFKNKNALIP